MSGLDEKRPSRVPAYPLLDGHKRKKQKLVPPLSSFAEVQFVSTLDSILPEVLWIGAVIETYGLRDAVAIVSTFLKSLWTQFEKEPPEFFRYSVLADPKLANVVTSAEGFGALEPIFAKFSLFYGAEWSPPVDTPVEAIEAQSSIEAWVKACWNRFEQPFLLVGGTIIYSLAISDRMKFAPGIAPDLEALAQDFESSAAKKSAGFIRASLMAFFPQSSNERAALWSKRFGDRNYDSTDCKINV